MNIKGDTYLMERSKENSKFDISIISQLKQLLFIPVHKVMSNSPIFFSMYNIGEIAYF